MKRYEILKREEKYQEIKFGTRSDKLDCVFIIPFIKGGKVMENYSEASEEWKQVKIPLVLAQMRWDGQMGFAGGKVDPEDNSLIDAVCREAREEICMDVKVDRLKPLKTFDDRGVHIHSYIYECETLEEIASIQRKSQNAEHYLCENVGSVLMGVRIKNEDIEYPCDFRESIDNLLNHSWCATARLELIELVKSQNLHMHF